MKISWEVEGRAKETWRVEAGNCGEGGVSCGVGYLGSGCGMGGRGVTYDGVAGLAVAAEGDVQAGRESAGA